MNGDVNMISGEQMQDVNIDIKCVGGIYEPFVAAGEIIESGLFPGLTEEKLRHYVRQGLVRAYGPSKNKTYLLSEVYDDWKQIGRRVDGFVTLPTESKGMGSGLQKAWRKV